MSKHVIEYDCECESCKATGLYIGFAEKNGSAVVCNNCEGTGKKHTKISYDDFEKRRTRKNVERVFQANPGIGIGTRKGPEETAEHGPLALTDFGGMPYKDWLAGKPFPKNSEMRRFTCPAWWCQCADYKHKPEWKECAWGGSFSDCKHFGSKEQCWERFDEQR